MRTTFLMFIITLPGSLIMFIMFHHVHHAYHHVSNLAFSQGIHFVFPMPARHSTATGPAAITKNHEEPNNVIGVV